MATEWENDNQGRLRAAMQAASSDPEQLFINAATNGDTKTVLYMLSRDINCPGHYGTENGYIALKPAAYQRGFDAAAKGLKGGVMNIILSRAPDRVTDFSVGSAVFQALFAQPLIYPEAELVMKAALEKKPAAIPYEIREVAKRLVAADTEQKKHLRTHIDEYLMFYASKKCYLEVNHSQDTQTAPLKEHFGKDAGKTGAQTTETSSTKTLPSYLRPVK